MYFSPPKPIFPNAVPVLAPFPEIVFLPGPRIVEKPVKTTNNAGATYDEYASQSHSPRYHPNAENAHSAITASEENGHNASRMRLDFLFWRRGPSIAAEEAKYE